MCISPYKKNIKVQNMKFPHLLSPFMSNSNSYIKVNILRNSHSHTNRLIIDTPHAKTENIIFAHWGLSRNGQDTPLYQSQPFSSPKNNIGRNSDLKIVRNYRVVRRTTTHIIQYNLLFAVIC